MLLLPMKGEVLATAMYLPSSEPCARGTARYVHGDGDGGGVFACLPAAPDKSPAFRSSRSWRSVARRLPLSLCCDPRHVAVAPSGWRARWSRTCSAPRLPSDSPCQQVSSSFLFLSLPQYIRHAVPFPAKKMDDGHRLKRSSAGFQPLNKSTVIPSTAAALARAGQMTREIRVQTNREGCRAGALQRRSLTLAARRC